MEVVADQLKAKAPVAAQAGVSSVLALGLVAAATAIYLVTVAWLDNRLTRHALRRPGIVVAGLAVLAAVVAAHAMGLPLPWAMLLMPLAPVMIIALVTRERARRPEAFAIR